VRPVSRFDYTDGSMRKPVSTSDRAVYLVETCPNDWRFDFPRVGEIANRTFDVALQHLYEENFSEVIAILTPLVSAYPEFIDAHHHLALALRREGQADKAYDVWKAAAALGLDLLPPDFHLGRDQLIWGFEDNRPFLRAYLGLGIEHQRRGLVGEALSVFQNLLYLNPNDNQGVRLLVVECFFRLRRAVDILRLCEQYDDDVNPDLLYGRVLALHQLVRKKEALAALAEAIRCRPLVAEELTKRTHRAPRDSHPGYVTMGGADEAFSYWQRAGEFWTRTPGALALVRKKLRMEEINA
jgi:tetratricopeptide (TPR) repeat protein